ncbi:MAG: ATP-binding protein [Ginsengibacter sp.]
MGNKLFDKRANKTRIGFLAAFILLLVSFILTYISTQKVIEQASWIDHNNKITHQLDIGLKSILKGESSFRQYIIGRDAMALIDYEESVKSTDSAFHHLKSLSLDRLQKRNVDSFQALCEIKYVSIQKIISLYSIDSTITKEIIQKSNSERLATTRIESLISKIQSSEENTWNKKADEVTNYVDAIKILDIVSLVLAVMLTLYSLMMYNKENKEKKEKEQMAKNLREQLEKRVAQLAELNKELIDLRSLEKYAVTGRIARTIAHEVRNPLTNINLSVEQLKSEMPVTENTVMLFNMVNRNSERINNLVSDLLNSTRINDLKILKIDINKMVDESLELASDRIDLLHIKITKDYDNDICGILGDTDKIKIALLNILVNAIEAIDGQKNGELKIKTHNENGRCVITINDNGKGMDKSQLDRLFEPYFSTKEKGNGLGLANTQNIILGHNGTIRAESQVNIGTTFIISFQSN